MQYGERQPSLEKEPVQRWNFSSWNNSAPTEYDNWSLVGNATSYLWTISPYTKDYVEFRFFTTFIHVMLFYIFKIFNCCLIASSLRNKLPKFR